MDSSLSIIKIIINVHAKPMQLNTFLHERIIHLMWYMRSIYTFSFIIHPAHSLHHFQRIYQSILWFLRHVNTWITQLAPNENLFKLGLNVFPFEEHILLCHITANLNNYNAQIHFGISFMVQNAKRIEGRFSSVYILDITFISLIYINVTESEICPTISSAMKSHVSWWRLVPF